MPGHVTSVEVFLSIIDDEVIDLIVTETNRFAQQKIASVRKTKSAPINIWNPTTNGEMKKFLGLTMWMGLVRPTNTVYDPNQPSTSTKALSDMGVEGTANIAEGSVYNSNTQNKKRKRTSKKALEKLIAVLDYNKGKSGIDLSDQMGSYVSTLRKGVKWYRKLVLELLLGAAAVNARVVYNKTINN
ncbi:Transposase IS4 [Popillia japonica]|uniref:Transposase IS4 n=1 Tax=Popillia japonica TaxID=7064 RepID=A0AAW1HUG7_POPJA